MKKMLRKIACQVAKQETKDNEFKLNKIGCATENETISVDSLGCICDAARILTHTEDHNSRIIE